MDCTVCKTDILKSKIHTQDWQATGTRQTSLKVPNTCLTFSSVIYLQEHTQYYCTRLIYQSDIIMNDIFNSDIFTNGSRVTHKVHFSTRCPHKINGNSSYSYPNTAEPNTGTLRWHARLGTIQACLQDQILVWILNSAASFKAFSWIMN